MTPAVHPRLSCLHVLVLGTKCVTCMQVAPYDFLHVDDDLSQEQLESARAQMGMWTSEGCYPLLPYSSIVLEAVPEQQSQSGRPAAAAKSRQEHLLLPSLMQSNFLQPVQLLHALH